MVGIAIDGVPIMPAVSKITNMDMIYPRKWTGASGNYSLLDLDTCMGSVDPISKLYSYRMLPICLTSDQVYSVGMCKSSSDCFSDLKSFTSTRFTQGNTFN